MADAGLVESFMEVTSCGSESVAVTHLSSCGWLLEDAINLYFSAAGPLPAGDPHPIPGPAHGDTTLYEGDVDQVRAPIPARSETLYNHAAAAAAASSSASYAAPSVWAPPPPPSPTPVQPVYVEYTPQTKATVWGSGGDNGVKESETANKEEQVVEYAEEEGETYQGGEAAKAEDYGKSPGEDGYGEYDYGTEEAEEDYISDDDAYLQGAESGHHHSPRQPRADDKNLDDLFRPPYEIMFDGAFHDAKAHAASTDRWLLVNVQSAGVFASHLHNRDLWSNEVVVQVIRDNFVFSLMDKQSKEGGKVCCFYRLGDGRLPAVLFADPITGQLLAKWCGLVQDPGDFLTSIGKYTESKPSMMSRPKKIVDKSTEPQPPVVQEPAMLENPAASGAQDLPALVPKSETPVAVEEDEQPVEGETVYKLRVRFPNGNTVTKEFGSKRRVATLFAYCRSVVDGQKGTEQAFRIMRLAAGRAFEQLRDDGASFEDLKLNRDTVTVVLDT